jgi:hypothetical protein
MTLEEFVALARKGELIVLEGSMDADGDAVTSTGPIALDADAIAAEAFGREIVSDDDEWDDVVAKIRALL